MRVIDADALLSDIERTIGESGCVNHEGEIIDCVRYAPTIDAMPVVRCRDCKYYGEYRTNKNKQIVRYCMRMAKNDTEYHVKPDDYCSYGERTMAWVKVSNNTSCEACKYRPRCDEIGNDWNCLEWSRSMTDGDYHQETEARGNAIRLDKKQSLSRCGTKNFRR